MFKRNLEFVVETANILLAQVPVAPILRWNFFQMQTYAGVAELVDARDLKSLEGNLVPVRFRPSVP